MYLRHTTVKKDGKEHRYWRLVRSVRRDGKVVQETVAHLGELDAQGKANARDLADRLMGRGSQSELFWALRERSWRNGKSRCSMRGTGRKSAKGWK
jgi:hypothetical protein